LLILSLKSHPENCCFLFHVVVTGSQKVYSIGHVVFTVFSLLNPIAGRYESWYFYMIMWNCVV